MQRRRALFSDIDGTLCFHEEAHGLRAVGAHPDGGLVVEDPASGRRYRARDVSASGYRVYMAEETISLCRAIRERFVVVLVTGGRLMTVESRRAALEFADGFILENGGVICDERLRVDPDWEARLEPERRHLPEVARALEREGWRLDSEGRTSGLRVRLRDNPHKKAEAFAHLCETLELPPALRKTINLENLDVILASAGKEGAVRFWLAQRGLESADAVGIGDDVNDVAFLRVTGHRYVLASAYPDALAAARADGWNVSQAGGIAGINEVLRGLLAEPPG